MTDLRIVITEEIKHFKKERAELEERIKELEANLAFNKSIVFYLETLLDRFK